jgi:hypothetical protein
LAAPEFLYTSGEQAAQVAMEILITKPGVAVVVDMPSNTSTTLL